MATLTTAYQRLARITMYSSAEYSVDYYMNLYGKYTTQDKTALTTTVQFKSTANGSRTSGSYAWSADTGTATLTGDVTASSSWTSKKSFPSKTETTLVESATKTFSHDPSTGKKSISVGAKLITSYSNFNNKVISAVTVDLPALDAKAIITSASDFNDEENPTIEFTNNAGFSVYPYLNFYIDDTLVYQIIRDESSATSPYTWALTDTERNEIRSALSTVNSCKVSVGVDTYNGTTKLGYSSMSKIFSIVNANPTATIAMADQNGKVTAVTGTSKVLVKGLSNPKVTVTPTYKKGATANSITIKSGGRTNNGANPYTFSAIDTTDLTVIVTDSRGNSYTYTNANYFTINDYEAPVIKNVSFDRKALGSNEVVCNAEIDVFYQSYNGISNVPELTWTTANGKSGQISGADWNTDTGIMTVSNKSIGTVVSDGEITTATLTVTDLFGSDSMSDKITLTAPVFDVGLNDVQINGKLYIANQDRSNRKEIWEIIYPVGSIYMSASSTNPQTLFGGTWTQLKDRFLLGAGDSYTAGNTGGEATHLLTVDEMPSHTHTIASSGGHTHTAKFKESKYPSSGSSRDFARKSSTTDQNSTAQVTVSNGAHTHTPENTGGGVAHNNMPPYLVVYMWKRTA